MSPSSRPGASWGCTWSPTVAPAPTVRTSATRHSTTFRPSPRSAKAARWGTSSSPLPRSTPCWEAWTGDAHRRQHELRRGALTEHRGLPGRRPGSPAGRRRANPHDHDQNLRSAGYEQSEPGLRPSDASPPSPLVAIDAASTSHPSRLMRLWPVASCSRIWSRPRGVCSLLPWRTSSTRPHSWSSCVGYTSTGPLPVARADPWLAAANHVRLIIRRAYGSHSPKAVLALVMLSCGPIELHLPHERAPG